MANTLLPIELIVSVGYENYLLSTTPGLNGRVAGMSITVPGHVDKVPDRTRRIIRNFARELGYQGEIVYH